MSIERTQRCLAAQRKLTTRFKASHAGNSSLHARVSPKPHAGAASVSRRLHASVHHAAWRLPQALALGLILLLGAGLVQAQTDDTPPTMESARVDRTMLTVTFSEALRATNTSGLRWAFWVSGIVEGGDLSPAHVSISGRTVTLVLGTTADTGQTVAVNYDAYEVSAAERLQDAAGNEVASFTDQPVRNVASPTPEPTPEVSIPGKPTRLTVTTEQGSLDVSVDWDDVDGAAHYLVRWRSADNGNKLNEGVEAQSSNTTITLADYGKWVVRVQACNEAGCGKPLNRQFKVESTQNPTPEPAPEPTPDPQQAVPAKPTGLAVTTEEGSLDVSVDWDDVDNAAHYLVRWRVAGPGNPLSEGLQVETSETTVTVDDYGEWVVRVEACNYAGCGKRLARRFDVGPAPNRAPEIDENAENYRDFIKSDYAPRGIFVIKSFEGIFTDPDGDELTYTVSVPADREDLVDLLGFLEGREFIGVRLEAGGNWSAVAPALSNPLVTEVTLTATDPRGRSASVVGVFHTIWEPSTAAFVPVCDRTPQVRDAIVDMVPDVADCGEITAEHLATITGALNLRAKSILTLQAGDLDGLTSLNAVDLQANRLTSLPTGLFRDLTMVRWVRLNNNRLLEIDENTLASMYKLHTVDLSTNNLKTIPVGLFNGRTRLHTISLRDNELNALPFGAFNYLVNLRTLKLDKNRMVTLPAGLFHDLTSLTTLHLDKPVNPRICDRSAEEMDDLLDALPGVDVTSCLQFTDGDVVAAMPTAGVCSRTPAVRAAIVSRASGLHNCASVTDEHLAAITGDIDLSYRELTELRESDLAGLSNLNGLSLRYNRLTSLPEGAFDDLAALRSLKIDNNPIATLPEGVFSELDSLNTLWLNNNRLTVAPAGLFNGLDTLQTLYLYSNGFTTLPKGLFSDLTSIRTLWLDHAVDPRLCERSQEEQGIILEQLTDISNCRLVTDGDVSFAVAALPMLAVCDRTPKVRDAILAMLSDISNCLHVTEAHLAGITGDLLLNASDIAALKPGDFDGLSNLGGLALNQNNLSTLPKGVFDDLTSLSWLRLNDNRLTELQPDIFAHLTKLMTLNLSGNNLTTMSGDLFAYNSGLRTILLYDNDLEELPSGQFDGLTSLKTLRLDDNDLTTLPARLFADLTRITTLQRDDAVDPKLCGRPQEEQDALLDRLPDISDCMLVTDSDVDSLSRPNIILIMADDLGYGDLGSYGQTTIKTPELDAMAAAGMRFTDFYAGHPVCSPSREALLTGRHTGHTAHRYLLRYWHPLDQRFCDSRTTLGEMLQSSGYRTAVIGKWGIGGESTPGQPNDQGFDYFYGYLEHGVASNPYPDMLYRNKEQVQLANVLQRPRGLTTGGHTKPKAKLEFSQDLFMEEALKFIEETSDNGMPFFVYLPVTIPHANSAQTKRSGSVMETPPDGYGQYADESWEHAEKAFAAVVSYLDKDVGRLLDGLEELGIANNTVTFFTSDNGAHSQGGHSRRHFNSSGPFSGGKMSLKEGGIRVPLIAHWPGSIPAGRVSDHVSASWDFMPTLAEIAGAPAPKGSDGVTMLPTLLGKGEQLKHDYLYWHYIWAADRLVHEKAVRWGNWKAIYKDWKGIALYNLADDPGETTDVARENRDVVTKINEIIAEAHVSQSVVRAGPCFIK